jgi:hypothetical protein
MISGASQNTLNETKESRNTANTARRQKAASSNIKRDLLTLIEKWSHQQMLLVEAY